MKGMPDQNQNAYSFDQNLCIQKAWKGGFLVDIATIWNEIKVNFICKKKKKIKMCLWNTMSLAATESEKSIFSTKFKVKVIMSLTLVSFERVSLVE